ncbi:MAG: GlsB/YeaQ/YmgE family stress response membrane protein [Candidatus Delongbacteria bacterium]|nr:GlsB/YeaQ/YmgE family stress response membrane protein [Candidatus Delongbacteria bacterium]
MGWIMTLIVGGIVGWLASILMKTNAQMGLIANILVGVGGSLLGTWLVGLLGYTPAGFIMRFIIGIAGAALLIFVLGKIGLFRKK